MMICTIPAVGGLWATPADLVRLGLGWTRLLPTELVREALTAQTPPGPTGRAMGLGWLLSPDGEVGLHAGVGAGATAALMHLPGGQVRVIVTNRAVPLNTVTDRLLHLLTGHPYPCIESRRSMYPRYPTDSPLPEATRPTPPPTARAAVAVMYAGAVASLTAMAVDLATVGATKAALAKHFPNLTSQQLNAQQVPLMVSWIAGGLVGAALWILVARNTRAGRNWARITGTGLFAVATIDAFGTLLAPEAVVVRVFFLLVWLIGLTAVVLLWQRGSRAYFQAPGS
ncbi:MAG TPA: hypothetical protein VGQ92_08645 [Actinoplanes sp.]|nr:hypothetical protein [Actinoplanes sp.]